VKIADLKVRQSDVNIDEAEVTEKTPVREFQKFGRAGRVCNVVIKDDSGSVQLTLWNEDVDKYDVGDKVKITDGFVGEWQGEKQVTAGKKGTIEKL